MAEGAWTGRRIHFVGIGGAGMSGLARIAVSLGAEVSGSDANDSPVLAELADLGAEVVSGHSAGNVPEVADVVWSSAIAEPNEELLEARGRDLKLLHRSELLAELTKLKKTIAVTGTHGKTTTSAMVLSALRGAGVDAGWVIGAGLQEGEPSSGWQESDWLVVEADESDRSLLALECEVAVVTNLELDHHATYVSFEDLQQTVGEFCSRAAQVVLADGPGLDGISDRAVTVAPVEPVSIEGRGAFVWRGESVLLEVPGLHNCSNAAAALEAASRAVDFDEGLIEGIGRFLGTSRRFEPRGEMACGALVYDDYAHHPTEVAATIAAARTLDPERVVAVFQPHLFSRTEELAADFALALAGADVALVTDIYPARERSEDHPGVDAGTIAGRAEGVEQAGSLASAQARVLREVRDGDLVLLMGAGDIGDIGDGLIHGS